MAYITFMFVFILMVYFFSDEISACVSIVTKKKKAKSLPPAPETVKSLRNEHAFASAILISSYENLPESHRPAYDVRAAVAALEIKYGKESLDGHFYEGRRVSGFQCQCLNNGLGKKRCIKPEFYQLLDSMQEIYKALKARDEAEAEREREIELAGIETELRSIEDITAALRQEKEIIYETVKEISAR